MQSEQASYSDALAADQFRVELAELETVITRLRRRLDNWQRGAGPLFSRRKTAVSQNVAELEARRANLLGYLKSIRLQFKKTTPAQPAVIESPSVESAGTKATVLVPLKHTCVHPPPHRPPRRPKRPANAAVQPPPPAKVRWQFILLAERGTKRWPLPLVPSEAEPQLRELLLRLNLPQLEPRVVLRHLTRVTKLSAQQRNHLKRSQHTTPIGWHILRLCSDFRAFVDIDEKNHRISFLIRPRADAYDLPGQRL